MEKIKIDVPYAIEVCKDRFTSKQVISCGVGVDPEVLDFLNSEKLGDEFRMLTNEAKKIQKQKNAFIARVRADDFNIHYELVDFETGEVLNNQKTLRGLKPVGDWEVFVFRVDDVSVRLDDPVVDPENMYGRAKKITVKDSRLFFAPPKYHLFARG